MTSSELSPPTDFGLTSVSIADMKVWLATQLSDTRYQHSLSTAKQSVELAKGLGCSEFQQYMCEVAALLHDCAKDQPTSALLSYCREHGIQVSPEDRRAPQTLHGMVGEHRVAEKFGIDSRDILDAIRWHTTGRAQMRLIEKIVFIADKTEPVLRDKALAKQALSFLKFYRIDTLDVVVLFLLNRTLDYLMRSGQYVHPETLNSRNEMLKRLERMAIPLEQLYKQPAELLRR